MGSVLEFLVFVDIASASDDTAPELAATYLH